VAGAGDGGVTGGRRWDCAGDGDAEAAAEAVAEFARSLPGRDPRRAVGSRHLGRADLPAAGADVSDQGEITVRGKGRRIRIVKIGHDAARSLDQYLRVRARHAQACRPQLWLGANNRGPMTASGICQVIVRRGRRCGVEVFPRRFRHHFSHAWLDRGGAGGDLMELNGWTSPQMLRRYGASARSVRARRSYDRVMQDSR
jgi:integrase